MRILVLNNGYLTRVPSGGDRHLLDLGDVLSCQHEVTFVLPCFAAHLPAAGARKRSYWSWEPKSAFGIMGAYALRALRALWISAWEPADIVLSSSGPIDVLPALLNKWRYGSRVAVYPFHLVPDRKAIRLMQAIQFRVALAAQAFALFLMRRTDVVFTDNTLVKAQLVSHGIPLERIHVQRPIVNVEQVRSAPIQKKYQVIFIGRMVRSKGVYDLVNALRDVPVTAGVIGDGEERRALQEYIDQVGIGDRVSLLGPLPSDAMYSLLKGCDLFVFPSYEEGYGIAVAEAIAAGKPVLAYDLPHYAEVFNQSIMTVPVGNCIMLAAKIRDFFEGGVDVAMILDRYRGVTLATKAAATEYELGIVLKSTHGPR